MASTTSKTADKTAEQKADEARASAKASPAKPRTTYKGVGGAEIEAFRWEGDINAAPDWIDRGWAGYDQGPALQVPPQRRAQQPYTTTTCRFGDYVLRTAGANGDPMNDTFKVLTAAEMGQQYDTSGDKPLANPNDTGSFRPPQESGAALSDMVKTGVVTEGELDPAAQAMLRDQQGQQGGVPAQPATSAGR